MQRNGKRKKLDSTGGMTGRGAVGAARGHQRWRAAGGEGGFGGGGGGGRCRGGGDARMHAHACRVHSTGPVVTPRRTAPRRNGARRQRPEDALFKPYFSRTWLAFEPSRAFCRVSCLRSTSSCAALQSAERAPTRAQARAPHSHTHSNPIPATHAPPVHALRHARETMSRAVSSSVHAPLCGGLLLLFCHTLAGLVGD